MHLPFGTCYCNTNSSDELYLIEKKQKTPHSPSNPQVTVKCLKTARATNYCTITETDPKTYQCTQHGKDRLKKKNGMLGKLMVILMVMVMVILGWVATYWGASSVTQATIRYSIIIQTGCLFWQRLNIHFAELQKIRKTSFHCHSCLILKKVHTHTQTPTEPLSQSAVSPISISQWACSVST